MTSRLPDSAARLLLMAGIVVGVLLHGAVESWSVALLEITILAASVVFVCGRLAAGTVVIGINPAAFPLAALAALGLLQLYMPWPGSLDPDATSRATIAIAVLAAAHLTAFNVWGDAAARNSFTRFVAGLGALIAVLSILQWASGNGLFFWYRSSAVGSSSGGWLTGPFVNHNHIAGFLELTAGPALAMMLMDRTTDGSRRALYGFAFVLAAAAIVLSASRGGLMALAAGVATVFFLHHRSVRNTSESAGQPSAAMLAAAAAAVIGAVALVAWLGAGQALDKLTAGGPLAGGANGQTFEESRGWIWRNSWSMFTSRPVLGVGIGAYQTAFPLTASSDGIREFGARWIFDRAHNDYLQMLTDAGLAGGAVLLWFLGALALTVRRAAARLTAEPAAAGLLAATVAMLVHSVVDFNLQLPGTALLFVVELGILAGAAKETAAE